MKIQYTRSWSILFEWNDILPYRVRIELRPVLKGIKLNTKRTMYACNLVTLKIKLKTNETVIRKRL